MISAEADQREARHGRAQSFVSSGRRCRRAQGTRYSGAAPHCRRNRTSGAMGCGRRRCPGQARPFADRHRKCSISSTADQKNHRQSDGATDCACSIHDEVARCPVSRILTPLSRPSRKGLRGTTPTGGCDSCHPGARIESCADREEMGRTDRLQQWCHHRQGIRPQGRRRIWARGCCVTQPNPVTWSATGPAPRRSWPMQFSLTVSVVHYRRGTIDVERRVGPCVLSGRNRSVPHPFPGQWQHGRKSPVRAIPAHNNSAIGELVAAAMEKVSRRRGLFAVESRRQPRPRST